MRQYITADLAKLQERFVTFQTEVDRLEAREAYRRSADILADIEKKVILDQCSDLFASLNKVGSIKLMQDTH